MVIRKIGRWLLPLWVLLIVINISFVGAESTAELERAPFNEKFVDDLTNIHLLQSEEDSSLAKGTGYRPAPVSLDHLAQSSTSNKKALNLSSSYDLRSLNKVTAVRDQGNAGSCWSFATYGSMESCLLTDETWDFSENNLKNTHGFDWAHDEGGNAFISAAYLSRWSGPITESADPYSDTSGVSPSGLTPVKHLQEVVFVPVRSSSTDNDTIKNALVNYGALYMAMYYNSSYYNASSYSYYYNGSSSANHAVTIVGWDDNYSRNNFSRVPSGDGAFIVKNSWGTSWGNNGYFYISYYDTKFGYDENALFVTPEATTNYSQIYQYDTLGWVSSLGYSSTTGWLANIFTAAGSETLKAVSFYTASTSNTYELRIYRGVGSSPVSGTLVSTQTGSISESGYFTIPLSSSVALTAGQKFSVVLKLTTSNYSYPIPIEVPVSGYSSSATASSGQSYISSNGTTWTDLTNVYRNTNVCLKAFTN